MTIIIIPKNPEVAELETPNSFWNAFFVETPVCEFIESEYTDHGTIRYEHPGFIGEWFTKEEALKMHCILTAYLKTEAYKTHRYFASRQDQLHSMLEFLADCEGFKRDW